MQRDIGDEARALTKACCDELLLNDKLFSPSSQRIIKAANIRERERLLTITKSIDREITSMEINYK